MLVGEVLHRRQAHIQGTAFVAAVQTSADGRFVGRSAPNVSVLKLTPQLQFTENELKAANAKVFFGYKTSSGVFINKGQIWPK